jgi:hypothetical protein
VLTVRAVGRTKANLSRLHLRTAQLFLADCEEITRNESHLAWPQPHWEESRSYASGAVILAVAALEATINELYLESADRNQNSLPGIAHDRLDLMATLWEEVDEFSILKKYEMALVACGKEPLLRGAEPYQSAKGVVDLRNALVHFKPEWAGDLDRHSKLEDQLGKKFQACVLASQATGTMVWFPHKCLGAGCASWSIDSVRRFVGEFCGRMGIPERFS